VALMLADMGITKSHSRPEASAFSCCGYFARHRTTEQPAKLLGGKVRTTARSPMSWRSLSVGLAFVAIALVACLGNRF